MLFMWIPFRLIVFPILDRPTVAFRALAHIAKKKLKTGPQPHSRFTRRAWPGTLLVRFLTLMRRAGRP
jgi:hypothetical protein